MQARSAVINLSRPNPKPYTQYDLVDPERSA